MSYTEIAARPGIAADVSEFEQLRDAKTVLLKTFRRDGTLVATPVSIAFDGDRAYFRSWDSAWKTKRLARNPRVEVAPSTFRGNQIGSTVLAEARLLEGREARIAARAWLVVIGCSKE